MDHNNISLNDLLRIKLNALNAFVQKVVHDTNNFYGVMQGYTSLLDMKITEPEIREKFLPPLTEALKSGIVFNQRLAELYRRTNPLQVPIDPVESAKTVCAASSSCKVTVVGEAPSLQLDEQAYHATISNLCLMHESQGMTQGQLNFDRITLDESAIAPLVFDSAPGDYISLTANIVLKDNTEDATQILDPFVVTAEPKNDPGAALLIAFVKNHDGNLDLRLQESALQLTLYLPI